MQDLGAKIYEYRNRKGWTQTELARRAGIAQANLSNIEKGKRDLTVSTLIRVASALEVKPSQLIEEETPAKTLSLTRAQIEKLAQTVLDPDIKTSSEIKKLTDLLRIISLESGTRPANSSQKIQHAWNILRQKFSSDEIRGICQRIQDARQRTHA